MTPDAPDDAPPPSPDWCLFLDVDGTLVELTQTPFDTRADAELTRLLRDVADRLQGALALVSGRSIDYLDRLFAPLTLPAAGLHGVERRAADGTAHGASFPASHLDATRAALATFVRAHPGTLLEDKGRTVAVHFRMAPHFGAAARDEVDALVQVLGDAYHVQSGNLMLEIKPSGFDKGAAIAAFLSEPPFAGRVPVYVGDDLTDIDGFTVVEAHDGLSVSVGDRVRARHHLRDPGAVRAWLRRIAALGPRRA